MKFTKEEIAELSLMVGFFIVSGVLIITQRFEFELPLMLVYVFSLFKLMKRGNEND